MHKPIVIYTNISLIEDSFDFLCPVCGDAWTPGDTDGYCEHVAFDFTPECSYIAERFVNEKYKKDSSVFLDDVLKDGCEEKLFIYEIYSSGMACGPMSDTDYFGYSLQDWADMGVSF